MLFWTFTEFPEQTDAVKPTPPGVSTLVALLDHDHRDALEDFLTTWRTRYVIDSLSLDEQARFWYVLGKAYIRCADWYAAMKAFETCEHIAVAPTLHTSIPLLREWAYASHEAHQYETAVRLYERLIVIVEEHIQQHQFSFLQEDSASFLCNIYRNLAFAWLYLGSPEVARTIIEKHAIPLLQQYHGTLDGISASKRETNWRLLHLYVPWIYGYVIAWQARLSREPIIFSDDLYRGYEALVKAAQDSRRFSEGHVVSASIHNLITEVTLMRCSFSGVVEMQTMLCDLAQQHLDKMNRYRDDDPKTVQGRLQTFVLELSHYELEFRKHIIFDTVDRTDPIIIAITDIYQQVQAIADPSYRFFTVRCLLLLGTIAAERSLYPPHVHTPLLRSALEYFQQGLDYVKRDSGLAALYEQEIIATMTRFSLNPL